MRKKRERKREEGREEKEYEMPGSCVSLEGGDVKLVIFWYERDL